MRSMAMGSEGQRVGVSSQRIRIRNDARSSFTITSRTTTTSGFEARGALAPLAMGNGSRAQTRSLDCESGNFENGIV